LQLKKTRILLQFRNNQIKRYPAGEVDTFKPSILPPGMGMSDKQLQNLIYKWKKRAEEFRGPAKDVALMILNDLQP
jgi:hypothetical protein